MRKSVFHRYLSIIKSVDDLLISVEHVCELQGSGKDRPLPLNLAVQGTNGEKQ
jgi:hypothetical protein